MVLFHTFLLLYQEQYLPGHLKYHCVNKQCFHLTEKAGVNQNWSLKIPELKQFVTRHYIDSLCCN